MLQSVGSMSLTKASFIVGNLPVFIPNLNSQAEAFDRNGSAGQMVWNRILIRIKANQREVTDRCLVGAAGIVAVGRQRNKCCPGCCQHLCHRKFPVPDLVSIVVRLTFPDQIAIQFCQRRYLRYWNQKVITGILHQIFDQTLFVPLRRITEIGTKGIMGGQFRIAVLGLCLFTESLFYANFGVVEDDPSGNATKELQAGLNGFQKGFLVLPHECHSKQSTRGAFPHTEIIDIQTVTTNIGLGAPPVDLHSLTRVKSQGNEHRLLLCTLFRHSSTDRRFPNLNTQFLPDSVMDALRGVLLLAQIFPLIFC